MTVMRCGDIRWNFIARLISPEQQFFSRKIMSKFQRSARGAFSEFKNRDWVGKVGDFQPISFHISETVSERQGL